MSDGVFTPQWLFQAIEKTLGEPFQVDVAASDWNTQCETYITKQVDARTQDWTKWLRIYCNPPFEVPLVEQFVKKAIEAAQAGSTVAMILPMWTRYEWYQEIKAAARIHDVIGSVAFRKPDGSSVTLNRGWGNTPLMVAFLGPDIPPGTHGEPFRRPSHVERPTGKRGEMINRSKRPRIQSGTNDEQNEGPEGLVEAEPNGPTIHQPGSELDGSADHRLRLIRLSSVPPEPTTWLWHHRIPLGELTLWEGDPADNKGSSLIDLAARVSTGRTMPDGTQGVLGGVLLLQTEDSLGKTIRKRLDVAGADVHKVQAIDGEVTLPGSHEEIELAIRAIDARLVIIDPLMSFLAPDANADQKVRKALGPLKKIAERTNSAIVMVRHLVKRAGKSAMYRGSGSIGIIAAARSAFLVARFPADPAFRVLCHVKSNLAPFAPSLLFEPVDIDGEVAIEWRGETDLSADDVLSSATAGDRLGAAMAFLAEALHEGPLPQKEIRLRAITSRVALRTLERAKEMSGVISARKGFGPGSVCFWHLPAAVGAP